MSQLEVSQQEESSFCFITRRFPRLLKISVLSALEKKVLATKALYFIESSQNSCCKEVISPTTMELEERASMEELSPMKVSE